MLNLATVLEDSARKYPDRDALVLGDYRATYSQVNAMSNMVANLLTDRGIKPGDRVALSCPNTPHFPVVYYGILKAGAVVVPLNVLLKPREIAYHLADSGAKAYFCFEGTAELPMGQAGYAAFLETDECTDFVLVTADPMATKSPVEGAETMASALSGKHPHFDTVLTDPDDTALILYTSGTTGQPKGAELTHSNILMNVYGNMRLIPYMLEPGAPQTVLVALPLFHSFGQTCQLNTGFASGGTLVLMPRFDPAEALALMDKENVTFFSGVPTMYWAMLRAVTPETNVKKIAANLRAATSGGSAIAVDILREFKEEFGIEIQEGYGLSESSPVATFNHLDQPTRPGSIGTPIWGVEVKLITDDWETVEGADEVGEIAIRGHNIMKGYFGKPEATAEVMRDGWFRTGDLAKRDEDGYYYIVDRSKDMIIRGGFNVYPRELEEVLQTHPAVSLVAVVGVPHESHGEEVKAYVIKHEGDATTEEELIAWCKENMASYKYPRIIEFRDALPMTATGKILKRELRP